MPDRKKYYRTIEQMKEDCLMPQGGGLNSELYFEGNIRYRAIGEVLRRIPDEDYQKLNSKIDEFEWFIPHEHLLGNGHPFLGGIEAVKDEAGKITLAAHAQVIYLSPILEKRAWDIVVAVVAHELAHLAIGHSLVSDGNDYDIKENEAWECVLKWGFDKEAKKHRASQKRKGFVVG